MKQRIQTISNLSAAIESSGLTLTALGEKSGVPISSLSRYQVSGLFRKVSYGTVQAIAQALGVHPETILEPALHKRLSRTPLPGSGSCATVADMPPITGGGCCPKAGA